MDIHTAQCRRSRLILWTSKLRHLKSGHHQRNSLQITSNVLKIIKWKQLLKILVIMELIKVRRSSEFIRLLSKFSTSFRQKQDMSGMKTVTSHTASKHGSKMEADQEWLHWEEYSSGLDKAHHPVKHSAWSDEYFTFVMNLSVLW